MARLTINVKRIEKEYEGKVVAQIFAFRKGRSIGYEVRSTSKLFKQHLDQVLQAAYYEVMPGPQGKSYYANHVEYFHPGTITFFTFLHDRLGWYGYVTDLMNKQEVTKSIFFTSDELDEEPFYDSALTKSMNFGDYMYKNKEGHTILVTVPPGYIAVSKGGKIIGPGKKIGRNGADLDKPDAKWRLVADDGSSGEEVSDAGDEWRFVKNPQWEQSYQLDPQAAKKQAGQQMMKLLGSKEGKYHPGMHKELYEEGGGVHSVPKVYSEQFQKVFNEGIALNHILEDKVAGDFNDQQLGGSDILPEHILLMSTDSDKHMQLIVPAAQFPNHKHKAENWVMFDASQYKNMPPETIAQLLAEAKKKGEKYHPALTPGALEKPFKAPQGWINKYFDMSEAIMHNLHDIYMDRITSAFGADEEEKPVTQEEETAAEKYAAEIFRESEKQLQARAPGFKRTKANVKRIDNIQKFDRQLEKEYFYKDKDDKLKPKKIHERMSSVKSLTNGKGSEDIYFDFLPDDGEPKGLMMHQIFGLKSMVHHERYAAFGGPEENDGMFLNWKPGIGKSYTVLAADAVMRNKGLFKGTHVITAPRAVVLNWEKDLIEFRKKTKGEDFFVIDGDRQERASQWEQVRKLTDAGKPPQFVIIGSGKMAFEKKDAEVDPDEDKEAYAVINDEEKREHLDLAMDLKYLRETLVETGNLAALSIDETGLFTNPDSKRSTALRALVNLATSKTNTEGKQKKQRSVIWTLNGNLMGNSGTDAIVEMGWVNAGARLHQKTLVNRFTHKPHKAASRTLFNREDGKTPGLAEFMKSFGHSINRMNYVKAVGKNNKHINDVTVPVGKEFGDVYMQAMKKLERMYDPNLDASFRRFKLGMITMMMNTSNSAGKANRMIEYGLDNPLHKSMKSLLSHEDYHAYMQQIQKYRGTVCDYTDENDIGWLPRANSEEDRSIQGYTTKERDQFFEEIVAPEYRDLLRKLLTSGSEPISYKGKTANGWKNPLAEFVSRQVGMAMHNVPLAQRLKMGFQSQSRMVTEAVHAAIGKKAGMKRQLLVGGTKQQEIANMQQEHASKKGSPIMSMMTGAATYGVNFNSDIAFVTETWNPARKEQGMSRFHRNIMRPITVYSLSSSGIGAIVRDVARQKKAWADAAENIDFNDDDAVAQVLDSVMGTELSSDAFIEKLKNNALMIEED